ncbi:hypothetical protein [Paenibacillus dakarensis]|nr:hypothetical protein [Paenibacillus dakarensis]
MKPIQGDRLMGQNADQMMSDNQGGTARQSSLIYFQGLFYVRD